MKLRLASLALIVALLGVFVLAPLSTGAAPTRGTGVATFTGTDTAAGQTVTGTMTDLVASVDQATGAVNITGILTYATGESEEITAALIGGSQQECRILFLDLGPLSLDLLGLQIDLSQIVLEITAVPGPGNLLGNLLCAVVGLLDPPTGGGNAITNLLNRLFGLLGLLG